MNRSFADLVAAAHMNLYLLYAAAILVRIYY